MIKEKLRSTRITKGFTQQRIAEAIQTTKSNYCRKENGEVKINHIEWQKLESILSVSYEDIYEEEEAKTLINVENHAIRQNLRTYNHCSMHENMIKHIMDYLNFLKDENEKLKDEIKVLKA